MGSLLTISLSDDDIKESTGNGKYINKSGLYDIILKAVILETSSNGSEYLNFWLEHEGQDQPLYQAIRLTNTDGSPNFSKPLLKRLAFVTLDNLKDGDEIGGSLIKRPIPMGKGGKMVECVVIPEFDDVPVTMRVQMSYSLYDGKIQESKIIKNFFRFTDKATASEIINSENLGGQYEKELEYADAVTYKDDLTPEDVEAHLKDLRSGKKKDETKTPTAGFSNKNRFAKKD